MELFGAGSADELCLSALLGAANVCHTESEAKRLHPSSPVNMSRWQQIKGSFIHSAVYELSLLCSSLLFTSEQKAYG